MNILFISAVLPYPLHSGGQVRLYNLLKRLSAKHDITLYAFIRATDETKYISELSFCKKVVPLMRGRAWQFSYLFRVLFSTYPFLYITYDHAFVRSQLEDELKLHSYDVVHIEPGYVYPSLPALSIPLVVAEHNIEHEVYAGYAASYPNFFVRLLMNYDVSKMKIWQKRIWQKAMAIIAVSESDKSVIQQGVKNANIHIVANGVDIEYFAYQPKKRISAKSISFVYVGNFLWMQNSDAVENIFQHYWAAIRKNYPGSTLRIIGKHFPNRLKKMLPEGVLIVDSVEDIRVEYRDADFLLAPIRIGGGTRYKILEAMAVGLPVITSQLGASGLTVEHMQELYIASNAEGVLHCIAHAQKNGDRLQMCKRASALVKRHYSWEAIAKIQNTAWYTAKFSTKQ